MASPSPGSFEYLEAKIRRDAEGTLFGRDFEWVCQWYLEHAPLYRGKFRRVWRWAEWPDRWGPDCGIDLVAETHEGKLWAIQAKAVGAAHSITKAEIDSFLAESNRRQIAFRLLMGTTDNIGSKARRTIDEQAKHASVVLRGDLVSADINWPTTVGGAASKPKRAKPKPHQRKAISAILRGFRKHKRGRLIMACGTGKTLTGLWIHEQLESRRTLLLVPSISLVQQNLREWGRHAKEDFDFLVVCSDESVASDRDDPALRYIAGLGIDVTTDAKDIAAFLAKRRRRPAVVIATYQSSDRVSAGQRRAKKSFDLALCDEAHRLVGDMRGKFATVLDDRKIRCRRRLFMTATPRYFTQRARERAADQDLEVASMDDPSKFGPEFHVLKFFDAITAKPTPLLTDYRVVVIGVTNAEAAQWVAEGKLVRTHEGAETDARTLAAQIGLAKAMREYDLRRVITFHRSIRRASRFVDAERLDSLPAIIATLRPASRPSGKLWARHISGETPASKRASMLKMLKELPVGTRGLIANCACLGEGVDVPTLDGIAFIDPKGSLVDIIQAVGRVIRTSKNKTIGTIVIPVFIDETTDAEHSLEQSAFEPVWQVLKALRAHDARLADELDTLRTSMGRRRSGRINFPANVILDVPTLALRDFEQAFYVRAIQVSTEKPPLTIARILTWADEHKARSGHWPSQTSGPIPETEETWAGINHALERGHRGLRTTKYSLAQLLEDHRDVRNRGRLPELSEAIILGFADKHFATQGTWPNQKSGNIDGTKDTWAGISNALRNGARGLVRQISLADLLWEHRGVPNKSNRPNLSIHQILQWSDEHKRRTGTWPDQSSGAVHNTTETWRGVQVALNKGQRGMPGGASIRLLLHEHRGVPHLRHQSPLTVSQILKWADAFHRKTGRWPKNQKTSDKIPGTDESWATVDAALRSGRRGLRKSSLADLLAKHRGVRNHYKAPPLTETQILNWADRHKRRTGEWPIADSGTIIGVKHEKWANVQAALSMGTRGLAGGDSLARLLERKRGVRNRVNAPTITIKSVLTWVDAHKSKFGDYPTIHDKRAPAPGESWLAINASLERGSRGLPGGASLPKLLAEHRGVARGIHRPRLKLATIVGWAREHRKSTGHWPTEGAGEVIGTDERWDNIAQCVRLGLRGCPRGWTLKKIIDKYCRKSAGRR